MNSMKRSCAPALSRSHLAAVDIVRGPGKSSSSLNHVRLRSYGAPRPFAAGSVGAPTARRIGARLPRIAFVAAQIFPRAKLGVVVLATVFEEVRMIGDEHRRHAGATQRLRDRFFPQLDRTPRLPRKVERAAQHVVPRRHARQRADEVVVELHRAAREAIEVRRFEFRAAVSCRACGGSGCRVARR